MPCFCHAGAVFQVKWEAVLVGDKLLTQTFKEKDSLFLIKKGKSDERLL
jgi:hypothetical protein